MKHFQSLLAKARRTVLVVDDEPVILELLETILSAEDLVVHTATSAAEARKVIASVPFGVAILDKNMPETSGIELLRELKREAPLAQCLIMTGYASLDSAIDAVREDAFDYLTKPFENARLIEKVQGAFEEFGRRLARAEARTRHESLFESIPGLVWFVADEGRILRINETGAAALGYEAGELEGQDYKVLLPEGDEARWAFNERRTAPRAAVPKRIVLRGKDGNARTFEVHSAGTYASVDGSGHRAFTGTVGVASDITDQLRLEEALRHNQKMEALGSLAGGVAHDYNNLLTIIGACVHMLSGESLTDRAQRGLDDLEIAFQRAADLTRQLLTFSHQRSHDVEDVELVSTIRSIRSMLKRLVRENVQVELELPDERYFVSLPPAALEQILLNLVANARDAMPEGGLIQVHLERRTVPEDELPVPAGDYACLRVSDTGMGIDAATSKRVFEPFFTTKPVSKGTGLGLATVYGLITNHGGHVSLQSELGRGTEVSVYLPILDRIRPATATAALYKESVDISGAVVLLAEDDELVRRSTCSILEEAGVEVLSASSGEEALEVFKSNADRIQVLVTDVVMPGISGRVLARRLLERARTLPIIFVSGYAPNDDEEDVPGQFLGKPYVPGTLIDVVRDAIAEGAVAG